MPAPGAGAGRETGARAAGWIPSCRPRPPNLTVVCGQAGKQEGMSGQAIARDSDQDICPRTRARCKKTGPLLPRSAAPKVSCVRAAGWTWRREATDAVACAAPCARGALSAAVLLPAPLSGGLQSEAPASHPAAPSCARSCPSPAAWADNGRSQAVPCAPASAHPCWPPFCGGGRREGRSLSALGSLRARELERARTRERSKLMLCRTANRLLL